MKPAETTLTAFIGHTIAAQGSRAAVTAILAPRGPHPENLLVFEDMTGRQTDLDVTGAAPARGRPKLGVTSKEVTLLPRHWDWLTTQRGGASATLRRLIDAAMVAEAGTPTPDPAYRFLSAIAGDFPGFEEAIRALYANDAARFRDLTAGWHGDVAMHALRLAGMATNPPETA
ncbi:DUF2239 family protein [Maritimibacter sp. DP1N21-5]|uniref:DUF2239 family protein n=1 Tax=Maritimibacter sp. DP1N21-5 TaxID=2836867 RepID=UPI001C454E42|nr:DUF2239 family protein [Maritimibacter sp. DP1N21-5]MBV7409581.1 DUF2239 family protein [Maritimibacter sp. DP1N21-5]